MTYRIAIRTKWGRRQEVDGQLVPDALGVLAVVLSRRYWFVIHVPSGFAYPISFFTDRAAQSWSRRFWSRVDPSHRLQLATSRVNNSVIRASMPAWEVMRDERPDRVPELEGAE